METQLVSCNFILVQINIIIINYYDLLIMNYESIQFNSQSKHGVELDNKFKSSEWDFVLTDVVLGLKL